MDTDAVAVVGNSVPNQSIDVAKIVNFDPNSIVADIIAGKRVAAGDIEEFDANRVANNRVVIDGVEIGVIEINAVFIVGDCVAGEITKV